MKIDYDRAANAAYIRRFEGKVIDSEELAPGIIYDYDETDRIVGIEILAVKQRTAEQFKNIDFPLEESEKQEIRQWFGKVTTVGNSMGVIFPKELVEKLRLSKGDMLYVLETPNGFELTPYDPEFVQQMEVAEEVMREDWNVLRKLAT